MDVEPANFGIVEAVPGAYRLKVRAIGTAVLFEVVDGSEREVVTAIGWAKLAPLVERDWSERLKAADHPAGRMPATTGEVIRGCPSHAEIADPACRR